MFICSVVIPLSKNPIYSIIAFICIIIGFGIILISILNHEIIGLILIIVYAGAIAVVFLFVIMMLNIRIIEISGFFWGYVPLSLIFMFILLYELSILNWSNLNVNHELLNYLVYSIEGYNNMSLIHSLMYIIYNYSSIWLLLVTIILLIAMVGTIVLTFRGDVKLKQQFILKQSTHEAFRSIRQKCIY